MRPCSRRQATGNTGAIAVLGLLLALGGSARAAEVKELLANGGFEALDSEGGPENWASATGATASWPPPGWSARRSSGSAAWNCRAPPARCSSAASAIPSQLGEAPPQQLLLSLFYRADAPTAPEVALVTFADDFTVQEWKTPVLTSEAVALEPSPKQWRSMTWHVRLLPAARQAVVMARIHGPGSLFVDGVSLKAYPAEVECKLLSAGIALNAKGDREARLRLTNRTDAVLPVRLALQVRAPKGPDKSGNASARLEPGKAQDVTIAYSYPLDKPAMLALTITSEKGDVIYDDVEDAIPGLLDGSVTRRPSVGRSCRGSPSPRSRPTAS